MAKKSDSPSSKKASGKQTDAAAASAQKVLAKQRGLGRGLSSLLGDAGAAATMTSASAGATPAAAAPHGLFRRRANQRWHRRPRSRRLPQQAGGHR